MIKKLSHLFAAVLASAAAALSLCTPSSALAETPSVPRPNHVVVVVMENRSYIEIRDNAPFINDLAARGALFTRSFAVSHPSQPNYFALFSGSTQGVEDNNSYTFTAPTLASALRAKGYSFTGYVERGSPRKHNPWESFVNSTDAERDLAQFPSDFSKLPTVSFVIPNLENDMHDGGIKQGDAWLRRHLADYAEWCMRTHDLLIVTFDEGDDKSKNQIFTLFYGGAVRSGRYGERIDHYTVLRTIENVRLANTGQDRRDQTDRRYLEVKKLKPEQFF
jgi:hypothetical protein